MIGLLKITGLVTVSILLYGYIERWYLSSKDKELHSDGGSATLDYHRHTESGFIYTKLCMEAVPHKDKSDFTLYGACKNPIPCPDHPNNRGT